jgi:hypothetical protein
MSPFVKIPFELGLDRETGAMSVSPPSMEDLRNVFLHEGKILMRRGFLEKLTLVDDAANTMTHVVAGQALRGDRVAIVVGYNDVNGEVHAFVVDQSALTATHIGEWTSQDYTGVTQIFPLAAGSPPPRVSMAEVGGRVFMAHDQVVTSQRARTVFYTSLSIGTPPTGNSIYFHPDGVTPIAYPTETSGALEALTTDFDEAGGTPTEEVFFRGVARHLAYLFGWGWGSYIGTPALEDRLELVRFSKPGEPTLVTFYDYAVIGDRTDPVVRCMPVGPPDASGSLLCFKETETYDIRGSSPATFGVFLLDQLYGLEVSRNAVNVSGHVFFWSNEGPRVFTGRRPSESLEIPLELLHPEPLTLVAEGPLVDSFAAYVPNYRIVLFVFGQRVYALTIRVSGSWKWSYWELGFTPVSAWWMPPTGSGLLTPPTGFPSNPVASAITDTTANLTVTNNSQTGNEILEVWVKPQSTTAWSLNSSHAVTAAASQVVPLTGLRPGETHDLAVRYRRGAFYTVGYTDPSPAAWPGTAQTSFATTLVGIPTITGTTWSRTGASAEQIAVAVTPFHVGTDVEVYRDGGLIHTESAPTGPFVYNDTGVAGETTEVYKVRHVTATQQSAFSGDTNQWAGPSPPISGLTLTWDYLVSDDMRIQWANGDGSIGLEIRDNYTGTVWSTYPQRVVITLSAGEIEHVETYAPPPPTGTAEIGVRHKLTSFGVDDYSQDVTDTVAIP